MVKQVFEVFVVNIVPSHSLKYVYTSFFKSMVLMTTTELANTTKLITECTEALISPNINECTNERCRQKEGKHHLAIY